MHEPLRQRIAVQYHLQGLSRVSAGLKGGHFRRNKRLPSLERKICEDAVQTL
jgi:hypothetical protein